MSKAIFVIIIVLVVVVFGAYFLLKGNEKSISSDLIAGTGTLNQPTNPPPQMAKHEVIYTDSGYNPKELKIKLGETVVWKNQSSFGLWTASAIHPSHTIYSGTSLDEHCPDPQNTSFDQCKSGQPGQSWSFKFDKKGTWRYHNHVRASDFGTIIVD